MSEEYGAPWVVGGRYGSVGVEVQDADGSLCVIVHRVQEKRRAFLARKEGRTGERTPDEHRQRELAGLDAGAADALARARLIAAAPDLLAAAQAALTQLQLIALVNSQRAIPKNRIEHRKILRDLDTAIRKATNEQQEAAP